MNTIKSDDEKNSTVLLSYMLTYSIIFHICCLFLELYMTFIISLHFLEEKKVYQPGLYTSQSQSIISNVYVIIFLTIEKFRFQF